MKTFKKAGAALGVWWLITGLSLPAQNAEEIVQRLQARYERVHSFSARFHQVFRSREFDREETGIVLMKKPGRMYWEYQYPVPKLFLADGKKTYFYVPKDNQVMVADMKPEAGTPLLFLAGKGKIREDFQVELESREKPLQPEHFLLRLTPKTAQGTFTHLLLEIIPSTYQIHRLSVIEPIGNRNDYILTDFKENVDIHDRQFQFKLPRGVEVIRVDS